MVKIRYSYIYSFLMVLLAGCSLLPGQPSKNQAFPSSNPASMPTTVPLTLELLKNAEYQAQNGTRLVRLVDGKYETGSGADYLSVRMLDMVAFGDINADNAQDAAIVLVENYGGTGEFEYLVPIFNNDGSPLPSSGYFLGDRVAVNSLTIADDRIMLDMMMQGPNDPMCCPSVPMIQSFKFYWGPGLVLVHVSSKTPLGDLREIVIETPGKGDEVANHFQLTGNVSISPFENTLMVRILDADNTPIYQGPIMVSSPDLGAPGNFDVMVDISDSPVRAGVLRIEIVDVSMADGSTLAMDSVDVVLK